MIKNIRNTLRDFSPYINGHETMKKASVLIPIVNINNIDHILFEVRSKNLRSQPNEISFPGGVIEENELPIDACVRETCEELGTFSDNIEIIKEIDLFLSPVNILIHPFVGIIKDISNLNINLDEVDHIFLVPISYLLENKPVCYKNKVEVIPNKNFPYDIIPNKDNYKFKSGNYDSLFYTYDNYVIWGITAKILENFLNIIGK